MKRIRTIHQPFNYGFTLIFEEFAEEQIEVLNAPGKFIKKANTKVKLPDGKVGEMDTAYIADSDGKILFEKTIVIFEHQRYAIGSEKNYMISNYVIQGVSDEKLPFYVLIASHLEKCKHQQEFKRTDSFIIHLQFLDLGERDNWERLYNIRNKLKFNKNLSVKDGINLADAILFAPEDCAKERTREAMHYFLESKITSKKLEYVLYSVFYCMIDAYFDEKEEYERMINMLNEKANLETKEKFASEIRRENRLREIEAERDALSAKNKEINAKNKEINAKNKEISAKNKEISTENNQALALIKLIMSEYINTEDKEIKKKISPFKSILDKCNV